MKEPLTRAIAREYRERAEALPPNGMQDIGERRKLRIELQERCYLTELEALNTVNGFLRTSYIDESERRFYEEKARESGHQAGRPVREAYSH